MMLEDLMMGLLFFFGFVLAVLCFMYELQEKRIGELEASNSILLGLIPTEAREILEHDLKKREVITWILEKSPLLACWSSSDI